MEKLIELLKQHENRMYSIYGTHLYKWSLGGEIGEIHCINELNNQEITYTELELVLKSKEYGFIKWLVENDKIDRDKILKENGQFRLFYYDLERVKNYDRLVMYLSVEDSPIEFLISILK